QLSNQENGDVQAAIDFVLNHLQLLAIVVGFIGTFVTIRRQTQVFQTYVALEFFRRYADISKGMPDRLRFAKYATDTSPIPNEEWRRITRSMIEYLNLCSEEFALWKRGRVPSDIWELWKSGLRENFEAELWRTAWNEVFREYTTHEPFMRFMKKLVREAERNADKKRSSFHEVEGQRNPPSRGLPSSGTQVRSMTPVTEVTAE